MRINGFWSRIAAGFGVVLGSLMGVPVVGAQSDFAGTVMATHPVAFYGLDALMGTSKVGPTTFAAKGDVTVVEGAPIGLAGNKGLEMDGKTGWVLTTQAGGVGATASLMAWVKLDRLASTEGRILYIAGESENGNDLDLQFETDDSLRFFTASGGYLAFKPVKDTMLNQWHMVVATLDTSTHTRAIYWDGVKVATDKGGGEAGKKNPLSIGESTVFQGRFFKGAIDEVGLWNRALTASEVAGIYGAAGTGGAGGAGAGRDVGTGAGPTKDSGGAGAGGGMFATTAKVEVGDDKGPVALKPAEKTAIMFLSAITEIEADCQDKRKACALDAVLVRLKYDPRTDPNYTYTVTASGITWAAHATGKKPGLIGFCFYSKMPDSAKATYNRSGPAGVGDTDLGDRSIDGDSFVKR